MSQPCVNIALIGAGLFARSAHVPAINKLVSAGRVKVVAVHSRSAKSVSDTKALFVPNQHIKEYHGDEQLATVLADPEVHAVVLVTPIEILPDVVLRSLKAGKHVLSEKPISPTLKIGTELIEAHEKQFSSLVWGVAENYYFEPTFRTAAKIISSGTIGTPTVVNGVQSISMSPDSPYYHTTWRQNANFQGGYLLDGGVHLVAAIRMMLGDIVKVTGVVKSFKTDLKPVDTMSTSFLTSSGCVGSLTLSFACNKITVPNSEYGPPLFTIFGDKGTLKVYRDKLEVITSGKEGTQVLHPTLNRDNGTALLAEISSFVDSIHLIKEGKSLNNNNDSEGYSRVYKPSDALKDVQFFESLIQQQ